MSEDFETEVFSSEDTEESYEEGQWVGFDVCDKCSNFSTRLRIHDGEVVCEDCFYE